MSHLQTNICHHHSWHHGTSVKFQLFHFAVWARIQCRTDDCSTFLPKELFALAEIPRQWYNWLVIPQLGQGSGTAVQRQSLVELCTKVSSASDWRSHQLLVLVSLRIAAKGWGWWTILDFLSLVVVLFQGVPMCCAGQCSTALFLLAFSQGHVTGMPDVSVAGLSVQKCLCVWSWFEVLVGFFGFFGFFFCLACLFFKSSFRQKSVLIQGEN